jgi:AcrR family transcriptional regulator
MASGEATAPSPRDRLLAQAVDHVAAHGVGDLSLRGLAAALGTSHRMLLYHFGSREGLLVAVVEAVEARQRAITLAIAADDHLSPGDAIRRMWRDVSDPMHWPHERLFFELYGQALQGRPGVEGLLDGIVESWVEPVAASARALGFSPEEARAEARLGLAVVRGLLLDLVATGEREGVDAAMDRWISSFEARLDQARAAKATPLLAPVVREPRPPRS